MKLYLQLYRTQVSIIVIILILFFWATTASLIAVKKETEYVVLAVREDSVTIVDENSETLDNVFLQNFIYTYVSYCYNYDKERFISNVSKCGDFMNPKLWSAKQADLKYAMAALDKEKYILSTTIEGVPQILPNGDIQIDARSSKTTETSQSSLKVRITLRVNKIPFFKENMTRYEVQYAKEEAI